MQHSTYDSSNQLPAFLEELQAVFKYRDLIGQLVYRDVVSRYKRSILGIAWTMINPLGLMLVLTIVFSQLFQTISGYPVYVLSGLIAWNFFSQATVASLNQTVWGGNLFHRIYIPRTTFAISSIGTGLVNLFLSIFPLLIIMVIQRMPIRISFVFIPISMLILSIFSLGVGLLISTLAIRFPDVAEMYQVVLTAWMYTTPIFYPLNILPVSIRQLITIYNPMSLFVEIFRLPIYAGTFPPLLLIIKSLLVASLTLLAGWLVFTHYRNQFIYRV